MISIAVIQTYSVKSEFKIIKALLKQFEANYNLLLLTKYLLCDKQLQCIPMSNVWDIEFR